MIQDQAFAVALSTDPGLIRTQNEDAVFVDARLGLAILADGMGGYNAGEVASGLAATRLAAEIQNVSATTDAVAKMIDEAREQSAAASAKAEESLKLTDEMQNGAEVVTQSIAAVASVSEETAAGAQEVTASSEKVFEVSTSSASASQEMSATMHEVATSVQNVSAAVEEQTAGFQEVSAAATELSSMAERLQEMVHQFKVDADQPQEKQTGLRVAQTETRKAA